MRNCPKCQKCMLPLPPMYHPNLSVLSIHQGNGRKCRWVNSLEYQILLGLHLIRQCNKMLCPGCHTVSCYICRKIINNGYEHFSNVGGSFAGVPRRSSESSLHGRDSTDDRPLISLLPTLARQTSRNVTFGIQLSNVTHKR